MQLHESVLASPQARNGEASQTPFLPFFRTLVQWERLCRLLPAPGSAASSWWGAHASHAATTRAQHCQELCAVAQQQSARTLRKFPTQPLPHGWPILPPTATHPSLAAAPGPPPPTSHPGQARWRAPRPGGGYREALRAARLQARGHQGGVGRGLGGAAMLRAGKPVAGGCALPTLKFRPATKFRPVLRFVARSKVPALHLPPLLESHSCTPGSGALSGAGRQPLCRARRQGEGRGPAQRCLPPRVHAACSPGRRAPAEESPFAALCKAECHPAAGPARCSPSSPSWWTSSARARW